MLVYFAVHAATGEEMCLFWVHKQRIVTRIASDFGGERWFWSTTIPAYKPTKGPGLPRPEKKWHGTAATKAEAKGLAEAKVRELREIGREAWFVD